MHSIHIDSMHMDIKFNMRMYNVMMIDLQMGSLKWLEQSPHSQQNGTKLFRIILN